MKQVIGIFLIPLLYARYSFVLFTPFAIWFMVETKDYDTGMVAWFGVWFVYAVLFGFIMGNLGLMRHWSSLLVVITRTKYRTAGHWNPTIAHSHSVWSHPILLVNDKRYHLSIAISGGGLYDEEDNIRRKAIFYYLFY